MTTDYALYQLGPYETLWKDNCSVCPEHVEFDVAANCDRQSVVDGRCFRGDWGEENDFFGYHFQFPPEWSSGAVEYTYSFRYWALGSWDDDDYSYEDAGSSHCAPSVSAINAPPLCQYDLDDYRISPTTCGNWDEWSAPDGSFDPYVLWAASGGDDGKAKTACFKHRIYSHSTEESSLTVGFWTWEFIEYVSGISGPRENEAWVVSDFEIEFTPPEFSTLKPDTTKTTVVKTSTTDAPTTTSEKSTTAVSDESTTASELQTTAQTKDATTKTSEAVTDTTQMEGKSTTTTRSISSTVAPKTTGKPLNTTTSVDIVETTKITTTEVTKDDKGGGGFLVGIALYGVVGGVLFCVLFCFLFCFVSLWNWNRRKSAQPKDEECIGMQLEAIRNVSEAPEEVRIVRNPKGDDMSQPCAGGVLPAAKHVVDTASTKKLWNELMADETPGRWGADEKKRRKVDATATHLLEDANEGVTTGDPLPADYSLKDAICDEEMEDELLYFPGDADKARRVTAGAPSPRRTREAPEGH